MKNCRKISLLTGLLACIATGVIGYQLGLKGHDHVGHINPLPEVFMVSTKLEPFTRDNGHNPGRIFYIENTLTKTQYAIHIDLITGDMHESLRNDQLPEDFFYFGLSTTRDAPPAKKNKALYQVTGFSMGCLSHEGDDIELTDDIVRKSFDLFCPANLLENVDSLKK